MERAAEVAKINEDMGKRGLNDLPDELILKIFSLLPMFIESVATHLMSKRWEDDPWKLQDVTLEDSNDETCMSFIYGSLLSNDAQTLERLHLKLFRYCSASDINFLTQTAVNRYVRKLRFNLFGGTLTLPSCLSTCTTLKSLILRDVIIKVGPPGFCLPSLKSLHLFSVEFFCQSYLTRLLKSCPVLEYLVVSQTKYCDISMVYIIPPTSCLSSLKVLHLLSVTFWRDKSITMLLEQCTALEGLVISRTKDDNVRIFKINVPTLKSLSINNSRKKSSGNKGNHGFWIKAPALEKLDFKDTVSNYLKFEYMPEVTKANIEVICDQPKNFIGSLHMIQHLSLCSLASETPHPKGNFFPYLEYLELCTCSAGWANLLASILNDAPRLRSLKLESKHSCYKGRMDLWIEPTVVPECLPKILEILEWRQYEGTEQERKVAAYILANATCLKMATFSTKCKNKYTELKKMSRVSDTCRLVCE